MKSLILASLVAIALTGCAPAPTVSPKPEEPATTEATDTTTIAPVGSGAGGVAPVQGAENIAGGSGGGTGQAAKDAARRAAGQAQPTVPEGP